MSNYLFFLLGFRRRRPPLPCQGDIYVLQQIIYYYGASNNLQKYCDKSRGRCIVPSSQATVPFIVTMSFSVLWLVQRDEIFFLSYKMYKCIKRCYAIRSRNYRDREQLQKKENFWPMRGQQCGWDPPMTGQALDRSGCRIL